MHTVRTTPEQQEEGLALLRDEILPWLRDSTGFRGVLRLTTLDRTKTLVITFWGREQEMRASAEAGRGLGALGAATAGSTYLGFEDYEVTFADADLPSD